ncbi:MAG: EAL domain-containing protein [Gammaproteobacteria bacterium]|nr:EAL domain-containing protein [Gammaproteobacteria bacterium]
MAWLAASAREDYQTATPEIIRAEQHWIEIETALRQVLEHGELLLFYRPKISMVNHRITGIEALVRWDRREKGIISPLAFIPVAEESGQIVPSGSWVLDDACARQSRGLSLDARTFPLRLISPGYNCTRIILLKP